MVKCEICGKELADPSSLYRHRKIHNLEKPHSCLYCERKFIQRYNMVQHMKVHEKKRRRMEAQAELESEDREMPLAGRQTSRLALAHGNAAPREASSAARPQLLL